MSSFDYFAENDPAAIGEPYDADAEGYDADAHPYDAEGWYPSWHGPDADGEPCARCGYVAHAYDCPRLAAIADAYARTFGTDAAGIPLGVAIGSLD